MSIDLPDKKRLKLLAGLAEGETVDVGSHDVQNPYLSDVIGFDLKNPKSIPQNYRHFVEGDCQIINSFFEPSSFDTIIAGELIEHLENPASFLRGCLSILKDSGKLLITTPNPYHWSTVVGNLFFISSGITYDHINLIPFRAMVALMDHTGWKITAIKNASGGMRAWHSTRKYFIPCPKALAWQHLYVCQKK
ncbi:MAG: class I SAM-dependent methyltransferase [Pseudodesulfovibrio sp.]|uniref:class I SAM-dependent methyltransferase n=1 Tax=Pseudodesulfovibrio sp. TaxID=2035812 RepID=UPI003D10ADC2